MSSRPSAAPDTALAPRLATRAVGGFGTSIVAGGLVGVLSWFADQLGYPLGTLLAANLVGVWLGLAFALGALARTLPTGALRGLIGLLAAVAVYYVLFALGEGIRAVGAGHAATVWGLVALVAGPVMGFAGAAWRHRTGWPRVIAVALPAAALIAEGSAYWVMAAAHIPTILADLDVSDLVLAIEVTIGLMLPAVLLPRGERLRGYIVTAAIGIVGLLAFQPLSSFIRGIADRF